MPELRDARRERFAREIDAGKSLQEAHAIAGYSGKRRAAWVLRHHPVIDGRVRELASQRLAREASALERAAERYSVTTERVVGELAKIGFANMLDYMKVDSNGQAYFDLAAVTRDQAAAITEVIIDEYKEGRSDKSRDVKRIRVKLADKRAALVDLGRHLGLFVDPSVLNVNVANFFTERPPTLEEWKHEIDATIVKPAPRLAAAGKRR